MAPPQSHGLSSKRASAPRSASFKATDAVSSSRNTRIPSSPPSETNSAIASSTSLLSVDSEGELESENDLPTMTPPPKRQLPLRFRNPSPPTNVFSHNLNLNSSITMPQMQRAYSSPGVDSSGRIVTPTHSSYPRRPSSPLSSGRRRSPLRLAFEESYPGSSWNSISIEPNIPENEELEILTPMTPENEFGSVSAIPTYNSISSTFPRSRRRPASTLHQSASAPSLHASARAASHSLASGTPPSLSAFSAVKYANEPYPTYGYSMSSTSSMPSTPTSLRSRSPSISSLDTIEDTPDAEEAAALEEETTKQRSIDEHDSGSEPRRKSLDLRVAGLRSNKDRKRWSVCGAERRADFSLEPIEE